MNRKLHSGLTFRFHHRVPPHPLPYVLSEGAPIGAPVIPD